ncbi:DUF4167 domain-containing protein [Brevundimonas lenta]|uniref:DUF4167 domain-containing protein n=1 Tax=Brevundimonas lenta TaxID=424796 RepID=A0A7W6JAV3_9CAUL|nr:DUF4167 domain-containing protein [Brevundimonas lenta]MBB4081716.1 hypothetical protein [Brevundimonas lenta]
MRDFKGMKRQRGRNRKPGGGNNNANATNPNRSWDSQGPENIKVRGNAQTVYERYMQLARDASAGGDRVLAENYTQHAEHYFRVLRALQPQRSVSEIAQRELAGQGFDIDFEDESGAQAAAIMAAQQAETDRIAQQEARQREAEERQNDRQGDQPRREWRDRDDREPREPREPRAEGAAPAAEGEIREGGRRETRRERWERRREERNRRFEGEEGEGAANAEAAAEVREEQPAFEREPEAAAPERTRERPARRPRREETEDEAPSALPGFLTRSAAPVAAAAPSEPVEAAGDEAPAPKRPRAPRRKAEAPADEG